MVTDLSDEWFARHGLRVSGDPAPSEEAFRDCERALQKSRKRAHHDLPISENASIDRIEVEIESRLSGRDFAGATGILEETRSVTAFEKWRLRGVVASAAGDFEAADKHFRAAIAGDPVTWFSQAESLLQRGGNLDLARKAAISGATSGVEGSYGLLAEIDWLMGDYEEAKSAAIAAIERDERRGILYLGYVYYDSESYAKAQSLALDALDRDVFGAERLLFHCVAKLEGKSRALAGLLSLSHMIDPDIAAVIRDDLHADASGGA